MPISPSQVRRFWASVLSLVIGYSLFVVYPRQSQQEYWLLKDAQQGIAVVTKIGWTGHGGVTYQYRVNQAEYTGADAVRNYHHGRGDMSPGAVIGQHLTVYYSASHPWLSQLYLPPRPSGGIKPFGVLFLAGIWGLEGLLILTVLKPDSRWALAFGEDHRFFLGPYPR